MFGISTKSSPKRQREEIDEQKPKRQRQANVDDLDGAKYAVEVNDSTEPSEISNMPTDFDEEAENGEEKDKKEMQEEGQSTGAEQSSNPSVENSVDLKGLSINELLAQAELGYRRKKVIETVFAQKYGTKKLEISGHDIKSWIKVLRLFGHFITYLDIDYARIGPKECFEIDRCLNENCADSLAELQIHEAPKYIMNNIKKSFKKLETLSFEKCHLSSNWTDFNRWFPMMRRLVLHNNKVVQRKCIEAHFPHLRVLEIDRQNQNRTFTKSNVVQALRLNPNLQMLKIDGISFDTTSFRNVNQNLPDLQILNDAENNEESGDSEDLTMESSEAKRENDDFADFSHEFLNMELTDLLQAAESNNQRKLAIEVAFLDKYQMEAVCFSPSSMAIECQNGIIFIGDIKVCLSFLRCFGHLIKKMQLKFDDDNLLRHLNEYCADSLVELNISRIKNDSIGDVRVFKKPFSRVEVLEFNNSALNEQLEDIYEWFPQIRCLKFLNETKLTDCECLMMPFSHLTHLTIDFKALVSHRMNEKRECFDTKSVEIALCLNPQIRSVAFHHVDTVFLHGISKHLQFLENIDIKWKKRYSDQNVHEMRFTKSLQELQINFNASGTRTQSIPLSFGRLKTLSFEASELNGHLLKFTRAHPSITEMSLSFGEMGPDFELVEMVKGLPMLKIFSLNGGTCPVQEVIYLLYKYPAMNKLRFRIGDRSKYEGMRLLLADEWQTSIDDMDYVHLKRRNNNTE